MPYEIGTPEYTKYLQTMTPGEAVDTYIKEAQKQNKDLVSQNTMLSDLDTQYESIRDRYMVQFTAMEQAVTSLKSTGDYLTNLFKAMNKDD